jgi:hypothetical protein
MIFENKGGGLFFLKRWKNTSKNIDETQRSHFVSIDAQNESLQGS